jgi:5'-nucleotidase
MLAAAALLSLPGCASPAPTRVEAPVQAPPVAAKERCLSIVAWNDLHGQLIPDDPIVDTGRVPAGGVVALADELADVRATGDAVVVLDAGDLFTGPLASTMAEGVPVVDAYKRLGVDAVAIGNHEFDFGPVGYDRITAAPGATDEAGPLGPRGALLARMAEANFPFLSANITRKGGAPTGWANHRASARIARGGFDVGVVGYTTRETPTTTLPPNVADLDFANGAPRVAAAVRELRAAGSAPIVLLAHASIDGPLPESVLDTAPHEGELAKLVAELGADAPDLIVAGHRHAWMVGKVHGVPIVSSDQHGVGLARVRYCAGPGSPKLGEPVIERRTAIWSGAPRTSLGADVAAIVAPWEAKVKPIAEAPVAKIPKECAAKALNGTALGDQIARATATRIGDAAAPPAGVPVVGLANTGGIRAPLGPGAVRFGDVFTTFPFENTVAACATTRAGLVHLLENALARDGARERFPLGIWGVTVEIERGPDARPRLVGLVLDGEKKPAADDAPVWLAISDFVLYGGDGLLKGVHCAPTATSQTRIRDVWKALLEREGACDGPSTRVKVRS